MGFANLFPSQTTPPATEFLNQPKPVTTSPWGQTPQPTSTTQGNPQFPGSGTPPPSAPSTPTVPAPHVNPVDAVFGPTTPDTPQADFNTIITTTGMPPASITDHTGINYMVAAFNRMGYQAAGGGIDGQGRQDSIVLNGQTYRVIDSRGNWQFLLDTNGSAYPDSGPGGGGAAGGGASPGAPGAVGGWTPDPRANQLYDLLMGRATQSLKVDPNDPIVRGQVDAFDASQQRANKNYLTQVAEKQGPEANIGAETRIGAENIAQSDSAFQATVMQNELTARRNEIQQALTQMGSLLSDQERLTLEEQLAQMNDAIARAQLAQNAYQFDRNEGNVLAGFPAA